MTTQSEHEALGSKITQELLDLLDKDPAWAAANDKKDNAFEVALIVARSLYAAGLSSSFSGLSVRIVHGVLTSSKEPHDKYEHAWVEIGIPMPTAVITRMRQDGVKVEKGYVSNGAVDFSNGSRGIYTLAEYRSLGNIDEYGCRSYDMLEYVRLVANFGTFGPFKNDNKKAD